MTVIYLISEGVPEREGILGEIPLQRCIDEFGLDPSQRVLGLREDGSPFTSDDQADLDTAKGWHVVAGVGLDEAKDEFDAGYYWLALSPLEAKRLLASA